MLELHNMFLWLAIKKVNKDIIQRDNVVYCGFKVLMAFRLKSFAR